MIIINMYIETIINYNKQARDTKHIIKIYTTIKDYMDYYIILIKNGKYH